MKERMTLKLEPCVGCGRMILTHSIANLTVKCEPTPMDGQGVAQELRAGRQIWTPEFGPGLIPRRLRAARPGDPKLLREHRCTAAGALGTPPPVSVAGEPPKGPETGVQRFLAGLSTPSSVRPTVPSGVQRVARPRSDAPRCSACSQPMADGTYAAIQVGEIVAWAQHVTDCQGGNP